MASQLTIRIPKDLDELLQAAARTSGLRRADVVRAALRSFLRSPGAEPTIRPADLVRDLIGQAQPANERERSAVRQALIARIRSHAVRPA